MDFREWVNGMTFKTVFLEKTLHILICDLFEIMENVSDNTALGIRLIDDDDSVIV